MKSWRTRCGQLLLALWLSGLPLAAKELTPYRHGYEQGKNAGRREGRDRVGDAGCYEGEREGYAAGALFGQQQLIDAAYAQGLAQGQADGARDGKSQGREAGLTRGREDGLLQGQEKARASADQASRKAVMERAVADGTARAQAATPQADGQREGRQAGLERARREANDKDFTRAREDYRQKQFATAPQGRSAVRQAPLAVEPRAWSLPGALAATFGRPGCPSPDYRYASYGSDNEEYQRGYKEGYREGVRDGFEDGYERQYRHAYDSAYALGVAQAQVLNLQDTADSAYQEGFDGAYQQAYATASKSAHLEAYTPAFESAYTKTYAELYPQFEAQHYAAIEEETYSAIYTPLFQAAFTSSEAASFDENYPKQAKLAYDQGWKAEAKDFVERPVRLIQAWLTPTDVEGVQLVTVRLRNFSAQPVAGNRIRVSLGDQTSRLYHTLPALSEMEVTGSIRLRTALPEQAELFAVIENGKQRVPLGTVTVAADPPE